MEGVITSARSTCLCCVFTGSAIALTGQQSAIDSHVARDCGIFRNAGVVIREEIVTRVACITGCFGRTIGATDPKEGTVKTVGGVGVVPLGAGTQTGRVQQEGSHASLATGAVSVSEGATAARSVAGFAGVVGSDIVGGRGTGVVASGTIEVVVRDAVGALC